MRFEEDILQQAVSNAVGGINKDEVKILSQETSNATQKGDNFTCIVSSLKVTAEFSGKIETLNFIAKYAPDVAERIGFLKMTRMFDKEFVAYESVLPKIRSIADSVEIPVRFPNCYYASAEKYVRNYAVRSNDSTIILFFCRS